MTSPELVIVAEQDPGLELRVNFGVFAGREATAAEVERLAGALLPHAEPLEIVAEQRYEFDSEGEATVYQVRVKVPAAGEGLEEPLRDAVEAWARECIAERRRVSI